MDLDFLMHEIVESIQKFLSREDLSLALEFLNHNDQRLAIEFICDKFSEKNVVIPEQLGKMLQVASAKLGLPPNRSWKTILIEESEGHKLRRLMEVYANTAQDYEIDASIHPKDILERSKKYFPSDIISELDSYFSYGEFELGLEGLIICLIRFHVPISKKEVDSLLTIWLDFGHNPGDWKEFTLLEDIEKKINR
jgi:hypothetical protein